MGSFFSLWIQFNLKLLNIGLDPARPLIRPGNQNRLDISDAKFVQVMHTNAGYYGEGGRVGHVDFCVNGGRRYLNHSKLGHIFRL